MTREEAREVLTQVIADLRLGKVNDPFAQGFAAGQLTTVLDAYEDHCDDLTAHVDQLEHEVTELEDKLDTAEQDLLELACADEPSGITGTDN